MEKDCGERGVTLQHLQKKLDDFARERNWEKFHSPRNILLALICLVSSWMLSVSSKVSSVLMRMVREVGELSEIFQWRGEVEKGLPGWNEKEREHVGEELSDVLLYLLRLADVCGVDLADAVIKKIRKNAIKYPVPMELESGSGTV